MTDRPATQVVIARELARLSEALAQALDVRDLDAAERFLAERGELLNSIAAGHQSSDADLPGLLEATRAVLDAEARSRAALQRDIEGLRNELAGLHTGARAARAYTSDDGLAPGFVDRRD